jgi:hypothetical protein
LDELGVVGNDTAGDFRYGEVSGDTVQEELAETLPDFNLFALSIIGQSISNDCRVVFVDDVVLDSARHENN